jgi:signal transduction histidine kinase
VREWVQRHVNRITYGQTRDALGVVLRLGERLSASDREDELLRALTDTVADGYRLGGVAVLDARGTVLAQTGDIAGEQEVIPLARQGREIGALLVTPRPGERLDRRTRDALTDFTSILGIAVSSALLAGELRRSRSEVVRAQEEERRALRQELHDGLGPALAGLGLGLQGARNLLTTAPDDADRLLDRLNLELEECVADIRRISRDLRPAVLDELGLVPAIEQLAARYRTGGLAITLDTEALPDLPEETAVAAYRIIGEAILNTQRHADATECRVTLRAKDDLLIEIVDDGRGFAEDTTPGVGLVSMEARAGQLGGTLVVDAEPSRGTAVRVRLPLVMA